MSRQHSDDDEVRAEYASLREHDAARVPEFDAMRRRVESRRASRSALTSRLRYATAAAITVIAATATAAMTLYLSHAHRATPPLPPIAAWESPTSSLLPRADRAMLAPPPLLSSVLDGVSTSALQRKGD